MTIVKFVCLLITVAMTTAGHAQLTPQPAIHLGSVAMDVPAEMVKRLTPLTRYLTAHTGINVSFRASPNMDSAIADLGSGVTRIAYLTPVAYLEARRLHGVKPLAAPLTKGKSTFHPVLMVKQTSPLRQASELKGKTFAFGDERARLQQAVVEGAGVRIAEFSNCAFLKHYDNIAKAVLNDDFDAGILTEGVFQEFAPRGLRVLHMSPPLPPYVFAVHGLPPATVEKLRAALLSLRDDVPEHRDILQALGKGYDGFVSVQDEDYELVRRLLIPLAKK